MRVREVAGGGRAVEVPPERLARWFAGFERRNGPAERTVLGPTEVVITAANGTTATAAVPFPPLDVSGERAGLDVDALVRHAQVERRIGLVLVRLGAHSIGIAEGERVVTSRTDRHLVHGRTAKGGWSQQRFARRRGNQARQAIDRAARDVSDVLGPEATSLDVVVCGGDKAALDDLLTDSRLPRALTERVVPWVLDVAEPRKLVLEDAARRARAVEIVVRDA
ncbi:acVLRF1 family peptidyl-tRNA hydrolase [Haloechinothrix salitolerans]|uniref:AcVLRF1 family peptidyl-tRNA hydrolase n=1 Tax=Haloechinothrix salitolerans TaxID=926830 RepID=A0ABW2C270_9PSEU